MESQSYPVKPTEPAAVPLDRLPDTDEALARSDTSALTARQPRELVYHRQYAKQNQNMLSAPFSFEVLDNPRRRWWNAYWQMYVQLLALDIRDKKGAGRGMRLW